MGKTPKPLSFLITEELLGEDPAYWEKMREQGHTVAAIPFLVNGREADLICGAKCWRMFDLDGMNLAIKSARNTKVYVKKVKKKVVKRKKKEVEDAPDST